MIIVMKADVLPESPEVQQVVRMAERYPDVTRRGAQDPGRDARPHRDLSARLDRHDLRRSRSRSSRLSRRSSAFASATARSAATRGRPRRSASSTRASTSTRTPSTSFPACAPSTRRATSRRCSAPCKTARHPDDARRCLQAAHQPVRLPGPRQGLPALRLRAGRQVRHQGHRHGGDARVRTSTRSATRCGRRAMPTGVMLQIGTRNAQNFELLKAVGQQHDFPVLFKRGMGITLDESLNACEYLATSGNTPDRLLPARHEDQPRRPAPQLRRLRPRPGGQAPHSPAGLHRSVALGRQEGGRRRTVCSTSTTRRRRASSPARTWCWSISTRKPEEALCDGPQALLFDELELFVRDTELVRNAYLERCKLRRELAPKAASQ